jgi:hypothetical protein
MSFDAKDYFFSRFATAFHKPWQKKFKKLFSFAALFIFFIPKNVESTMVMKKNYIFFKPIGHGCT